MENITMLNTWINPTILAICLVVGYAVKHRLIPVTVVVVGIVTALWMNQWGVLTPDILLSGALSGLASTGLHQLFKQWIEGKAE